MKDITERGTLTREDRSYTIDQVEVREDSDGVLTFDGTASFVDRPYVVRDAFGEFNETFLNGSFKKTIQERDDVALLVNHEGIPMARTTSNTLTLEASPNLRAVAPLDPASPLVQTVASAMRRGDLNEMSVGFRAIRQEWNEDFTDRKIAEAALFDVSIVTRSANGQKKVASLRSYSDFIDALTRIDMDADDLRRVHSHIETLLQSQIDGDEEREIAMNSELAEMLHSIDARTAEWRAAGLLSL